jgi:hypothetical protein
MKTPFYKLFNGGPGSGRHRAGESYSHNGQIVRNLGGGTPTHTWVQPAGGGARKLVPYSELGDSGEAQLRAGAKAQLDRGAEEQLNRSAEEYRMASAMR